MKYSHEELREKLPDFALGAASEGERSALELHLKECPDCRAESDLISEMLKSDVEGPGDLFWKTLPQRVKLEVRGKNDRSSQGSFFRRVLPLTAVAGVLIAVVFSYVLYGNKRAAVEPDFFFSDPLSATVFDYSVLEEKDIPVMTEDIGVRDVYQAPESISGYGYYRDFVSLNEREMQRLAESLQEDDNRGG